MDLEGIKKQLGKLYAQSDEKEFLKALELFLVNKINEQQLTILIANLLVSNELKQELNNYTHSLDRPDSNVSEAAFAEISEQFRQTPNNGAVNTVVQFNRQKAQTPTPPKTKS